jgi:outer membrane receptor protein involved in Fe transport|tara:strand:- start:294 stop:2651 length:2358 start_codon:yes stop_codon:yes gene_type:complete
MKARNMLIAVFVAAGMLTYSTSWAAIEEIVVTATKRALAIQEVPFSINAQTQEDIRRIGATNLEDLSRNVAGLAIQNLGPGQSQVGIRGVSAGQIVRDQPGVKEQVGVYMDESVVSLSLFTPDFDLYDLNRLETLRGPQGTLFGSGSIGGTVRYITNQPNADAFEAELELDFNSIQQGSNGGHIKAMVNAPLDNGSALRAVLYSTEYAGYIDAYGENGAYNADVNTGSRDGARIAITFSPSDNLTITPRLIYQEIDADGYNRQEVFNLFANPYTTTRTPRTFKNREQHLMREEGYSDTTKLVDVVVEAGFDGYDLTFVGSSLERDIVVSRDATALTSSVWIDIGYPDAQALIPSNLIDTTDLEQTTAELRFSSNTDGQLQWLFGVFYSDTQRDYAQRLPTPNSAAGTDALLGAGTSAAVANGFPNLDSPFNSDLPYDIEQTAVFGEVTYDVNDKLQMTFGGRYYNTDEVRVITTGGLFANGDAGQVNETSSSGFTPRVLAKYNLNENTTLNAQISQGFRLGGVNDPLNTPVCSAQDLAIFGGYQDYGDETLWNYEVGMKSTLGNGATLNAAAFYADMEDLQVTLDAGSCSSRITFNVPEAKSSGVEIEYRSQPTDNLELSIAASVINAKFKSTVMDATGSVLGGLENGNRLASVPEVQLAATTTYLFPLDRGDGFISATVHYIGDRITQPGDQRPGEGNYASGLAFGGASGADVTSLDLTLASYTILNFRAGVTIDNGWEAAIYMNNATDENANLSFDRERGGRARLGFRTNQPRTIGVTVRRSF